jgi:hypothetical protein
MILQGKSNGQSEDCCSYTSSNRESWGRCSSLGGSDEEYPSECRTVDNSHEVASLSLSCFFLGLTIGSFQHQLAPSHFTSFPCLYMLSNFVMKKKKHEEWLSFQLIWPSVVQRFPFVDQKLGHLVLTQTPPLPAGGEKHGYLLCIC